MKNEQIGSAFKELNALLFERQSCWNFVPFDQVSEPWSDAKLDDLLSSLTDQTDEVAQQVLRSRYFHRLEGWLADYQTSIEKPATPYQERRALPFWLKNGIPGRKVEQIEAMSALIDGSNTIVEWCAGKGHLGRTLAYQQQAKVESIEWQAALCAQGEVLSSRYQLAQRYWHADVLQETLPVLPDKSTLVALHACGDLHLRLLGLAIEKKHPIIHLAPCCYHLTKQPSYQGLSKPAQMGGLSIQKSILKLAVQDQVTSGARITRLRKTEVVWRLAYQALRAEITGNALYCSLPSLKKSVFSGQFSDFVAWGLNHQKLKCNFAIDSEHWLNIGRQRHKFIQRLERVRHVFQRPLEYWLVMDRALYLIENGFNCEINSFCDYQTTPRNLIINAQR